MNKRPITITLLCLSLMFQPGLLTGLGRADENDFQKHEQLMDEVKQLELEKEILEKKLQEIQSLLALEDPSNPGVEYLDNRARKTLTRMAKATERFAKANGGVYPSRMSQLTENFPPFIKDDYCNREDSGFRFSCKMSPEGFKYTATPITLGKTGSKVLSVTTGGSFFNQ
ncbi:MAG: hypothetical protein AB7S78_02840 [Candidatus Omnitrophota bacterium]